MSSLTVQWGCIVLVLAFAVRWRPAVRPRTVAPTPSRGVGPAVDARSTRLLVAVTAAGVGWILGGAVGALLCGSLALVVHRVVVHRAEARRRSQVAEAVPDLIDLFLIAASAGQPAASSLLVVAPRAPPALASYVEAAAARFGRGLPLADCLAGLGQAIAPEGQPLADALAQAAASGAPLVPLLEGVAATARDQRRRRAQEVAHRLPVTMLLPLVACTLPAAVLLAVVPVLVVSVGSLSL